MNATRKFNGRPCAKRASLLATSGLATLMLALSVNPGSALAAMTVTPGGSVQVLESTATTATTNTDGANGSSSDQIQLWDNGTPIVASTDTSHTISGNGLALEETGSTAATIDMTNNRTIGSTAASGIGLLLLGNGGDITYTGNGTISGPTGLEATNVLSGAITLTTATGKTIVGTAGDAIDTSAVDGDTLITIGGTTRGAAGFTAINASATGAGNLDVEITAGSIGLTTSGGIVLDQTGTGSNTIDNNGTITAAGTVANPAIAIATTNAGSSAITNNAGHAINGTSAGLAILSTVATGSNVIVNAGTLTGQIYLSNQTNSLTNSGTWTVQDNATTGYNAASFGTSGHNSLTNSAGAVINAGSSVSPSATFTGVDAVNNAGTIDVYGMVRFQGDASFDNTGGLIDMRSTSYTAADVTALNVAVSGNSYTPSAAFDYTGGGGSELGLDALLAGTSSTGADVPSDRLLISGAATGTTGILLQDSSGPLGSYNPAGITLVAVNGASADAFYLAGVSEPGGSSDDVLQASRGPMGAIKKGFWFYPLLQTTHATAAADGLTGADSSEYRLYGLPDVEAFQTPLAITGAENIWYDTAPGWNQRQSELRKHWPRAYGSAYADGKFNFWAKASGNWDKRTSSDSLDPYTPVAGTLPKFDTSFNQNTYSLQIGTDAGFNRVLGGALMFSMSAGIIDSTLKFKSSENEFSYSGVTAGVAADYLHGGFFWDALLKGDFLEAKLNYSSLDDFGFGQQSVKADTWGVLSSAGYHMALGRPAAFLEPLVTIAYTSSTLGRFPFAGTNVDFNLSHTFRGALGARLGSSLVDKGGITANISITGNYWNEFTNGTSATLLSSGPAPALTLSDARQKGYGEVTGQVDIASKTAGWSGFIDGGAKFNSQSTSIELSGGIAFKW